MRLILFGAAVLSLSVSSVHAAPVDHELFLDVTCAKESRSENIPAFAVGDGGNSRGECQISLGTARMVIPLGVETGIVPRYMIAVANDDDALKAMLHVPKIGRGIGTAFLIWMEKRGIVTVARLAYAWNGGPHSQFSAKPDALAFAVEVSRAYREARKARAMRNGKVQQLTMVKR